MTLSAAARSAIASSLRDAPRGDRTATAKRLASHYGVSQATIYRIAGVGGARRRRAPARPEYREWTRIAAALRELAPKPVPWDLALEAAVAGGDLPPEAAKMPVATMRRIAREEGWAARTKRTHRLSADYPMQAVQIDGSSSEHLVVAGDLGGGDYLLRLHRRPYSASGYKNKPLGPDRLRVLLYSIWDMCTGYALARYCVAKGENAFDAMDFLCWACADKDEPRVVMRGVPDDLWSDQGPLWKHAAARDLLERLDVELVVGEPYAKERMGGVERTHRTRWERFERALFLRGDDAIRLSECNARLAEYQIRENAVRRSRTFVGGRSSASRAAAWTALTNSARPADNPLRRLPDNPIETLAREAPRVIDGNGIVRWLGEQYECADWHDRRVLARQALDGGDLVLEDEATGERRVARRWRPRPYGEIRAAPASELDRLRADPPETAGADLYAPGEQTNVVPMPARIAPAAPLDNPLDGDRCVDLDEAMRLFAEIYPHPLGPAARALVIERLEGAGLMRDAVSELAQELSALPSEA